MTYCKDAVKRMLVDESGTAFAEFGLSFLLIALIVFLLVAVGEGSALFFEKVSPLQ